MAKKAKIKLSRSLGQGKYRAKLTNTLLTTRTAAKRALNKTTHAGVAAYENTKEWIANVDKQSISQYLGTAWKVVKNGGRRGSSYIKNSYRLARSKKYRQSNTDFISGVTCLGLVVATCFVATCELLMLIQLLRKTGYVRTTPHNLLTHINSKIEGLSGGTTTAALNKVQGIFRKVFSRSNAANISHRGYSFLSAGIKTRKSA